MSDPGEFVFFGASSPWVHALATALAQGGNRTLAISLYDYKTYRRVRPAPPRGDAPARLKREVWTMPPGYSGALAALFTPVLRHRLAQAVAQFQSGRSEHPWVIAPYPWFGPALRDVPANRLIYFNYDDYTLFRPERGARTRRQERDLVERAELTLCSSRRQAETLRTRWPGAAGSIRHFPHGVVEGLLNPQAARVPSARTVGYVGNLVDRVDWRLVSEVADQMPDVEFIFVGNLSKPSSGAATIGWEQERAVALGRPNVRHAGPVPQEDVGAWYWNFGVNWIPYTVNNAFNQACCPTKIMDGLASGRPLLSTDLPECRLYPEWINLTQAARDMVDQIRRAFDSPGAAERAIRQVEFARGHIWKKRAELLNYWLFEA